MKWSPGNNSRVVLLLRLTSRRFYIVCTSRFTIICRENNIKQNKKKNNKSTQPPEWKWRSREKFCMPKIEKSFFFSAVKSKESLLLIDFLCHMNCDQNLQNVTPCKIRLTSRLNSEHTCHSRSYLMRSDNERNSKHSCGILPFFPLFLSLVNTFFFLIFSINLCKISECERTHKRFVKSEKIILINTFNDNWTMNTRSRIQNENGNLFRWNRTVKKNYLDWGLGCHWSRTIIPDHSIWFCVILIVR